MATYMRQGMPNEPKNTWAENAVQAISFDFVADGAGVFASQSIADIGGRLAGAAVITPRQKKSCWPRPSADRSGITSPRNGHSAVVA